MSFVRQATPWRPSRALDICLRNSSEAEEIPNGSQLKQYLPYGVMNVVGWADSVDDSTCQNPAFASNLEK